MRGSMGQENLRAVSFGQKILRICGIFAIVLSLLIFVIFSLLPYTVGAAIALLTLSFGLGLLLLDIRLIARRMGIRWIDRFTPNAWAWVWFVIGWLCIIGGVVMFFYSFVYNSSKIEDWANLVLCGTAFLTFYEQTRSKQAFAYIRNLRQISIGAARWWRQRR